MNSSGQPTSQGAPQPALSLPKGRRFRDLGSSPDRKVERRIAVALCAAVVAVAALGRLVGNRPDYAARFAPYWLPLAATLFAAAGLVHWNDRPGWLRVQRALLWSGLLLMVWAANGLMFDWLRVVRLIPLAVDWPGLVTRTLALAATIVLAHLALARPPVSASPPPARWYGYAGFVLALPYPVLRTCWAMGGTIGLGWAGAAGKGWAPWLLAIPWLMAAALSLLLVPTWRWLPRRLLLVAGWSATTIVIMIGPSAIWSLISAWLKGSDIGIPGIAAWVPGLFYGSWFLWGIAAGAATRSYQLRSAALRMRSAEPSQAGAAYVHQ